MLKMYRVYDQTDNEILADSISDLVLAYDTLQLLKLQYPNNQLEIEEYVKYTVTGLGRDPDLH